MTTIRGAHRKTTTGAGQRLGSLLGAVLNPVNSSCLAVALTPIGVTFHAEPDQTIWLVTGLYLATAIGQPVAGRLVDLLGPRWPFLAGVACTGIGGLLGAAAPTLTVLLIARVVIGLGTCVGYPAAMTLLKRDRGRDATNMLAALTTVTMVIAVAGPPLGGLLVDVGGWRWTFLLNVPLTLVCVVLGWNLPTHPGTARRLRRHLDFTGIGLFTAAILPPLLLFVIDLTTMARVAVVVVSVAALGLFVQHERATKSLGEVTPFIDVDALVANAALVATFARTMLTYLAFYTALYALPIWWQQQGGTAAGAGLVLLPMSATALITPLVRTWRPRTLLITGGVAQLLGWTSMCVLNPTGTDTGVLILVMLVMAVVGVAQGMLPLANQITLHHDTTTAVGVSAGLARTVGYLGAIVASSLIGATLHDGTGLRHLAAALIVATVLLLAVTVADRSLHHNTKESG